MTEIAMWHPKNTNIPTRERKCLVQEALVGLWAGLLTATSRPAGKSTTKRRTTTIPQKDIPQNAGETATLVQGGSATINTGDNKGKTRNGQLGIGNHRNIDSPSRFYFIMKCINLLFLGVCVLCVWKDNKYRIYNVCAFEVKKKVIVWFWMSGNELMVVWFLSKCVEWQWPYIRICDMLYESKCPSAIRNKCLKFFTLQGILQNHVLYDEDLVFCIIYDIDSRC